MQLRYRIMVAHNERRYRHIFKCFESIDQYFPREDINKACNHIETWAKFKSEDAKQCEKYRQHFLKLRTICICSGISVEAIETADWLETSLGINAMDSVLSEDLGQQVVDYIISAGLVIADQKNLCVWSANAPSQIREFILERLYCKNSY